MRRKEKRRARELAKLALITAIISAVTAIINLARTIIQ